MKFKIVHSAGKSPYKNISCNNIGKIIKYNKIDIEYISKIRNLKNYLNLIDIFNQILLYFPFY